MSKIYSFKCTRCGQCCTDIISKTPLASFGAFLLPKEVKLFHPNHIVPLSAVGKKGITRPRPQHIISYQMITSPCPHYHPYRKECAIYSQRPLTCKSFPIEIGLQNSVLHRECPEIEAITTEKDNIDIRQLQNCETEIASAKLLSQYFWFIFRVNMLKTDLRYTWFYNYETKKWFLPTSKALLEALNIVHQQKEVPLH